ncbi:MAG TPA: transcription elongation factor GreA [Treponema sp.]|jgi:transcription elongation factor GreA-like protein/transcription elongation GreA/GreB family factor|nr:transcription elongation factor GreA [Treponema sp.]HBB42370.1 transcription elongation factor GreA [Treponema sp.]HCA20650.1 transcription elongation factor GreA [Treponema sp.]
MSEELENSVREMLKESTWTRAGINDFTKNKLTELSEVLKRTYAEDSAEQIKAICDEQLNLTKESLVALYLSGMISLKSGSLDNSSLETLVDIFEKNISKEQLVEQLCDMILEEDPNNRFALRKLAAYYKKNDDQRAWDLYKKIVQLDFEEADIAKMLGDRYEKQQNEELAITYYKMAITRYVSAKNFTAVKELWSKLIFLNSGNLAKELDFFLMVEKKVLKVIGEEKAIQLLEALYNYFKNTANWSTAISLLKDILAIDNKDTNARKELVECYREYYNGKDIEDAIRKSQLEPCARNVFEAISDFEKNIAFAKGNYVYHGTWHVGRITNVSGDKLRINFGQKTGEKEIALSLAVSALQPLSADHFWVKKATIKKEKLAAAVKANVAGTLKSIISSYNNACDDKMIKAELVPSILSANEWPSWHQKAQRVLRDNQLFAVNPNNANQYIVRDHKLNEAERFGNEFKAEKQFFPRVEILLRYIESNTDITDEIFRDMFNYFGSYLKAINNVDEQVVSSYLVTQYVAERHSAFTTNSKFSFADLYADIDNPRELYTNIKSSTIKDEFIKYVGKYLSDWDTQFVRLFPVVLKKKMLDKLLAEGREELVKHLVQDCFENYRNNSNAVIYFFKECRNEEWYKAVNIPYEKQLITLVNIISQCYREVNNHVNTTENKKTIKAAVQLLFAEKGEDGKTHNNILDYMMENDESVITRMYTLVNDIRDLEITYKTQLRNGIIAKYPDFKFQEAEIEQEVPKGLLVTAQMLEAKRQEAENIEKVLLPQIAKEVAEARAKGDLKENAEYSSARERQSIENRNLGILKDQLAQAVIFDPNTVTTSFVSFGTKVTLHDNINNTDLVYTILGPWESNIENGILSYNSPRGEHIMGAKVNENRKFSIDGNQFDLTVVSITAAKF